MIRVEISDNASLPLVEFDPSPAGMVRPFAGRGREKAGVRLPQLAVLCFFGEVVDALVETHQARVLTELVGEHGRHPVYEVILEGTPIAVFQPGIGAPLCAGFMEEAIVLGARTLVACGGAGSLVDSHVLGQVIVPDRAVRDEGTSFHYQPPSREVSADPAGVAAAEAVLTRHGVPFVRGKTWTTDAIYRETPAKVEARRAEGCLTVEMEAAAFFAVARFRGVRFAQLLYAGDSLAGPVWASRDWQQALSTRARLFRLAAETCVELARAEAVS